jgi:hypothetical protein
MMHFETDVQRNVVNRAILSRWPALDLPNAWLVAGCLFQTIWNIQASRPAATGIKDYDIFYFDPDDLSENAEAQVQAHVDSLLGDLGIVLEVANQARVHLWYPDYFGEPYSALTSAEEGISRFLVQETCVAIRPGEHFAPYGLSGVYAGTLTPNPLAPHAALFRAKAASYRERWEWLQVIPISSLSENAATN